MDKAECIKEVSDSAIEVGIELRRNRISAKHFASLMQSLRQYREMIRGHRTIDREIASTLHNLEIAFIGALRYPQLEEQWRRIISETHQEFVPTMMEILNPEPDQSVE